MTVVELVMVGPGKLMVGHMQALVGPGLATSLQVKQVHSEQDDDQLQKLEGTIKATLEQLPLLILILILTKLPQE